MNKEAWRRLITEQCEAAGTYREYFDSVIDTLAGLLEIRDSALERFAASGGSPTIWHTNNRGGGVNTVKNPELTIILDCNQQALAYWRDLGLTPAGLKKLNEKALKEPEKSDSFSDILSGLGI